MISVSEIIMREIRKKGYKSALEFCEENGMAFRHVYASIEKNRWTVEMLDKIGKCLNLELKSFANAKKGREKKLV